MSYEFADGFKIRDQNAIHFLTFTIVDWVDLFSRKTYRDIFLNNLNYCRRQKGLRVGAYVIMSNHVHLICQSTTGCLSDTVRDLKSYSTKLFIGAIQEQVESRREWLLQKFRYHANGTNRNKEFKVWTGNNHPEEVHSGSFLLTKLNLYT